MELFENKVGRPSNEIRSKRKKFVAGAVSLSLVAIFAITLAVKNVATNNLQGKAMGNNTGDIDGSGTVNYIDLELALRHIANIKKLNSTQIKYGDINKDGKITYDDAKEILRRGNFGKIVGDVDGNKKVTENDARKILRYVAKLENYNDSQKKAADVDGDGKITALDAKLALIKVYGTSPRKGDINGDGKIDKDDYALLAKYVAKTAKPKNSNQSKSADINNDGKINGKDYKILYKVVNEHLGDVDGDGKLTFNDVSMIMNSVSKISSLTKNQQAVSDVDLNGKIEMKDARILSWLVGDVMGDANGDGRVTKEDAILVLKYVSNQKVTDEQKARIKNYCNMDGKNGVTATDARIIYRISN